MYNHQPSPYTCPLCLAAQGIENEKVHTKQSDIIYRDTFITAQISSHWWPKNPGHVLIFPNRHIENLYDLPLDLSNRIHAFEKRVSIALKKAYQCDGVSSRQHNEPAGNQDIWHYHLHVFPRYFDDDLYLNHRQNRLVEPEQRRPYAEKLRRYFSN